MVIKLSGNREREKKKSELVVNDKFRARFCTADCEAFRGSNECRRYEDSEVSTCFRRLL